ncbi:hypothetical protein FRC04_006878 [Tulasnella sp. 424]|nr:hypothetical protein FRC04_006878 [Tulasnella sp. 424]KAG8974383.1 hypothetical protein FRC05_007544 [Tulasnella sp. 425]
MSALLRQVARAAPRQSRFLSTSQVSRKDLVQDMYLRELKAYKPAPQAKDAHLAHVKAYKAPSSPTPPALPADLASELSAYDTQEPGSAPTATTSSATAPVGDAAAEFLSHLEADIPHEAHH